jgi:hypothetical protein
VSAELLAEFVTAAWRVRRRDFVALEQLGVPSAFLYCSSLSFGVSPIDVFSDDGTFQSVDCGELAIILPTRPIAPPADPNFPDDDVGDLVAWRASDHARSWRRRGVTPFLNERAIDRAEIFCEELLVHPTPLDWMRAAGSGIVILDRNTDLRLYLGGLHRIVVAGDPDLAEWIDQRLRTPPQVPRVFLRPGELAA